MKKKFYPFYRTMIAGLIFVVLLISSVLIYKKTIKPHLAAHLAASHHHTTVPDSITHHVQIIDGKKYSYTTRIGTITLYDNHNRPTATMSYTADTLDNVSAQKRPITFLYNGGPGASSTLLRMASFGPKRVILNNHAPVSPAPYQLVNNKYSLLNKTDLVFIDMPGTGFGQLLGKRQPKDFYSTDQDVDAFATFIQTYIGNNHRWNSPKFLLGESYGTTRTAMLVNQLQQQGMQINGIILLSSILDYGLLGDHQGIGDWEYVLYLPSFAAASWHFHKANYHPQSLKALLKEVKHFALTDYLEALAQGSKLPPAKFHAIAKKLHYYLGIETAYIERKNLRLSLSQFSSTLLVNKNEYTGRFDARFNLFSLARPLYVSLIDKNNEPILLTIKDALLAAESNYYQEDLQYNNPIPYQLSINIYDKWDFQHKGQRRVNASIDLTKAMTENPYLQVFSGSGYYDFATPFFATIYTFHHLILPPSLVQNITMKFYSSGNMIYLDPSSLAKLKQDLDNWYELVLS